MENNKNDIANYFRLKATAKEYNRLKFNHQIFASLLSTQKSIDTIPDDIGIILGNPNAKNVVVKVCSPYCNPCAKAHSQYESLLEKYENGIKLHIIFSATSSHLLMLKRL